MRNIIVVLTSLLFLVSTGSSLAADSAMLDKLQGKWEVSKTNDEGQKYKQVIEIKKDKLQFRIIGDDGMTHFYATGDVQAEKKEPFNVLKITNIKMGSSEDELEPVNDDRTSIYRLDYNTLTLVGNMDKVRENEQPSIDVYRKVS